MDNLSTVDKLAGPNVSFIERLHCILGRCGKMCTVHCPVAPCSNVSSVCMYVGPCSSVLCIVRMYGGYTCSGVCTFQSSIVCMEDIRVVECVPPGQALYVWRIYV